MLTQSKKKISLLSDRRDHPAKGLLGGLPGAPAVIEIDDGTRPHPKSRTSVASGRRVRLLYAGGGGFGDPRRRDRTAIEADLRNGYVTEAAAKRDYGVE